MFVIGLAAASPAAATIPGLAGSADSQLAFAEYLAAKGDYEQAGLEYQRYRQYPQADPCRAAYLSGVNWQRAGQPDLASAAWEEAIDRGAASDPYRRQAHLALVRHYLSRQQYPLAAYELSQLRQYPDTALAAQADFLEILLAGHQYQLDTARARIARLPPGHPYAGPADSVARIIEDYWQADFRDPFFSYLLSSGLPGAGHFYSGQKAKGTGAFLLMSGLTAALGWSVYRLATGDRPQRYVAGMDAAVIGFGIWNRYYKGIKRTAYEAAALRNRDQQLKYQERLRQIGGY